MTVYHAAFIPIDGAYAAIFPDLPGCNAQAQTLEEACAMAAQAVHGHIVALLDYGDPIPQPSSEEEALAKLRERYALLGLGDLPEGFEMRPVPAPNLDKNTEMGMC